MSAAHPARYRGSAMLVSVYWVAVRANSSVSAISSSTAITAGPAQPLSRVMAGGPRRLPAGVRHRGTRRRWQVLLTAYPYSKVWSQAPSGVLSPGHQNQARTLAIRVMRPPAVHRALGLAGWLRRGLRG